ncbi:MAG: hypothetical protein M3P43_02290, partial [Actinomycetota bacterium]|nr:hypothetical protein [Actinomycetota bacterium]
RHQMSGFVTSHIMRTTIDIDASVLRALKRRQRQEGGKTLGQLVSELLAAQLRNEPEPPGSPFAWSTAPMGARIDLEDKEAVRRAMEPG